MGCLYSLEFPNGKTYIGITSGTALDRFKSRLEPNKRYGTAILVDNAIHKYGAESVVITELVYSDDWKALCQLEREYIAHFNTKMPHGYNMTDGGDGSKGLKWNAEQRARVSARLRGNTYAAGCKHTPEGLERLRQCMLGNRRAAGNRKTPEGRERQRLSQLGRKKSLYERAKIACAKAFAGAQKHGVPHSPYPRRDDTDPSG